MSNKKRKCVKGKACGNSCISRAKACRIDELNKAIENSINKVKADLDKALEKADSITKGTTPTTPTTPTQPKPKREYNKEKVDEKGLIKGLEEKGFEVDIFRDGDDPEEYVLSATKQTSENTKVDIEFMYSSIESGQKVFEVGFQVNESFDATRNENLAPREKLAAAKGVKEGINEFYKSLEDGTLLYNEPYYGDDRGDTRTKAYLRQGFQRIPSEFEDEIGLIARIKDGKIDKEFNDLSDFEMSEKRPEIMDYYAMIFGVELNG